MQKITACSEHFPADSDPVKVKPHGNFSPLCDKTLLFMGKTIENFPL
jgi:hypothetical protein